MPQLDVFTFLSQFFWFSISFCIFYFYILRYSLPLIAFNIKFRRKKILYISNLIAEKADSFLNLYTLSLAKAVACIFSYVVRINTFYFSVPLLSSNTIDYTFLSKSNKRYLQNLFSIFFLCSFHDNIVLNEQSVKHK